MDELFRQRSFELVKYINHYEKKYGSKFVMKNVTTSVKHRLYRNRPITPQQFQPISKFVIREEKFKSFTPSDLLDYFSPLFTNPHQPDPIRLDSFFD